MPKRTRNDPRRALSATTTDQDRPADPAPTSPEQSPGAGGRAKARLLAGGLVAACLCLHVWIVSAGRWTDWPTYGVYYNLLADGFALGQTWLHLDPDPKLLALPDPYDPAANGAYRLHDAVLYAGRYYLYWGPLPALLLAAYKVVLTADASVVVGDQYLAFGFGAAALAFVAATIVRLRERAFPDAPWWAVGPPIVSAALAGPVAFTLARASVYEAAILGGQAFLAAAAYALLVAFTGRTAAPRAGWLAAAGTAAGAALACRSSLLLAVAGLVACVGCRLFRGEPGADARPARRVLGPLAAFAAPVVIAAAALAAYNTARFGSPTEFGVRYQLAGIHSSQVAGKMFAARYVAANVWRGLFAGPELRPTFPYVLPGREAGVVRAVWLPPEFIVEPVPGLAWSAPFVAFALVPPCAAAVAVARSRSLRARGTDAGPTAIAGWFAAALATVAVLGALPALAILASTGRYQLELTAPAAALAAIGFWQALRAAPASTWRRRAVVAFAIAAVVWTAVLAPLLGFTGLYGTHFWTSNPELYDRLAGPTPP